MSRGATSFLGETTSPRFPPLAGLANLEILDLSRNPIRSFAPLLEIAALRLLNAMGILVGPEARETLTQLEARGVKVVR